MRGKEKIKWSNSSKKELNLLHSQSCWWGCLGCSQLCRKNEWMNKLTNGCRMCVSCCTPFSVSGALYFMGKFNCFWPGRELTSPQSPALHKSALHINIRTCVVARRHAVTVASVRCQMEEQSIEIMRCIGYFHSAVVACVTKHHSYPCLSAWRCIL